MSSSEKFARTAYTCPECAGKLMNHQHTFECRTCGYTPFRMP
ncbi:hypothetical protein SAMN05192552_101218 [Natrinema hispanicum]|uniref:Uncharacterized protein n=1 Tax=Natrinema hispanicum TaxID=392421 RepID=A0A1G6RUR7_9EURY|nr:hypothetical protein SAMN05192552_101218 [Natrinema hispanicum]SET76571.1 hypothetical protein SAMN04488694_11228 [Natrinema hispanicum]